MVLLAYAMEYRHPFVVSDCPDLAAFQDATLWQMFVLSWRFLLHSFSKATASFWPPNFEPPTLSELLFLLLLGAGCLPHLPFCSPLFSWVRLGYQGGPTLSTLLW